LVASFAAIASGGFVRMTAVCARRSERQLRAHIAIFLQRREWRLTQQLFVTPTLQMASLSGRPLSNPLQLAASEVLRISDCYALVWLAF